MKAFFFSRLFREKILLLGLVLMMAGTWFVSVLGRSSRLIHGFSLTSDLLATQNNWLKQQTRINAEAKAAVEHLDPSKTFDGVRLQAEIAAIAGRTGVIKYSVDNVPVERTPQFSMNTVQLQIRDADYATLVKFYVELSKEAPYIGIEQFRLSASNSRHNAALRISSVEIAK
jgi:hypothetical protein